MPKSSRAKSPLGVRMRFPGCGSPWKNPSSKAILKIASAPIEATRRRSEGASSSGWMSRKRVPSTYCSVRTLDVDSSRYTAGITTGEPAVKEVRKLPHEVQVRLDPALSLGALHLDGHNLSVPEGRPVDLADARRAEGNRIEALEYPIYRRSQLLLDYCLRCSRGHGSHRVLEFL